MEALQALKSWRGFFGVSAGVWFVSLALVGCSTKKVMEDNHAKFQDINEEFEKVVSVAATPGAVSVAPSGTAGAGKTKKTSAKAAVPAPVSPVVSTSTEKPAADAKAEAPKAKASSVLLATDRRPPVDPFGVGEKIVLTVSYFNANAGEATLSVDPITVVNERKAYEFVLKVKSSKTFNMLYAVDNTAKTHFDYATLVPLTYFAEFKESSRRKEARTFYDWSKNEATHWEKTIKKGEAEKKKKVIWTTEPFAQSYMSAVYYLRTFAMEPGAKFSFPIADSGKNYVFHAEVLRREKLKTEIGELDTVVIRPRFQADDQFKSTGENLIWLTDDANKWIVRIESKIKIGTLVAKVKSITKGKPAL